MNRSRAVEKPQGRARLRAVALKKVRDPIHDYIPLDAATLAVVDKPEFQRLRRVRQLGTATLVYPGANHARFEHSLGAQHLARLACEALGVAPDASTEVRMAALLHDVGHGPFSHLSDNVMRDVGGFTHADASAEAARTTFADALSAHGADPKRVGDLLRGRGDLGELVSSELDVDRMDYLVRDAHYTGVNVGVDLHRIVHEMRLTPKGVALHESALAAAEMLLVTRHMMYTTVYFHPTCRVGEVMMERAIRAAVKAREVDVRELPRMDDVDLVSRLRASATRGRDLLAAVERRDLLKSAVALRHDEVNASAFHTARTRKGADHLETEIAEAAGVDAVDIVVDAPALPVGADLALPIVGDDGSVTSVTDRSQLVSTLAEAQLDHWRLRVFAPRRARGRVADAAARVLKAA